MKAERIVGGLVVALAAFELAVLEAFLLPFRIGATLVPISIPLALLGNAVLPRLAYRWTGSRLAALLPAVLWIGVVLIGSIPRPEGDLIVTGSNVNIAFLVLGTLSAAYTIGRIVTKPVSPAAAGSDSRDAD